MGRLLADALLEGLGLRGMGIAGGGRGTGFHCGSCFLDWTERGSGHSAGVSEIVPADWSEAQMLDEGDSSVWLKSSCPEASDWKELHNSSPSASARIESASSW